jgi:hypothetical protein
MLPTKKQPHKSVKVCAKWRRRESNADREICNDLDGQELANSDDSPSTLGPRTGVCRCREVSANPQSDYSSALDYIAAAWPRLQPHVREAIMTLIDAGSPTT